MKTLRLLSVLLLILGSGTASAIDGASTLLQTVNPEQQSSNTSSSQNFAGPKLNDPFLLQLFAEWRTRSKELGFELNMWVQRVLRHDWEAAAHLLTVLETNVPESFQHVYDATRAYLFLKLGLKQTFLDQWLSLASKEEFSKSQVAMALEQVLGDRLDLWIQKNHLSFLPVYRGQIQKRREFGVSGSSVLANLEAWSRLRRGSEIEDILFSLPEGNEFRVPLAESLALHFAKNEDLAKAGQVLKHQLEPELERKGDPILLSRYYVHLARLLYQAGALDASREFYQRIPNESPDYLTAQEELSWVYLRLGEVARLRGHLESLQSSLFEARFQPEAYLVRAVSNLKLCRYGEVKKDFEDFITRNRGWASQISKAMKATNPPRPLEMDWYSTWAASAIEERRTEMSKLEGLGKRSIRAALPAVGEQSHWKGLRKRMAEIVEYSEKAKSNEFRRFWKNRYLELEEAIRKMKFVKVELLSQVRELARSDRLRTKAAAPKRKQENPAPIPQDGQLGFRFDGVFWPDELFHLQSSVQSDCLSSETEGS